MISVLRHSFKDFSSNGVSPNPPGQATNLSQGKFGGGLVTL